MNTMGGILTHPLTVVEAPMGYGKTTAVREYLREAGSDTLWYGISAGGSDDFWNGFAALFYELDGERAQSLAHLRFPGHPQAMREAIALLKDIDLPENTVLVIDDYHSINIPGADEFFELLAKSGVERLHVVLITRIARFQNLQELILKGRLHHITKDTFELSPREIAAYYKSCGMNLTEPEVRQLYADTEAWISALYLIMLEYAAKGGYTHTGSIYKLIEKVVYIPLPEELRDFLVTMCVFDSFSLPQAVYIWGAQAGAFLRALTDNNAFDLLPGGQTGKTLADFTDTGDIAPWAKDAMALFVKTGTVSGSSGLLTPTGTTTRAQMAQVLCNLLTK
ncbi:MAG TPA: AAA family ATPase [Candidatus Acidoferrum sp.]|nr:AAA family ATPase [Candidatus Acidoferrum sp.]